MCVENHTCDGIMKLFLLFGIILCSQVLSQTLSGNGTSGGFTVKENASLQLTCTSSTDVQYVTYCKRYSYVTQTITAVGYGPSGCVTDPTPPSYLSCSCVSRREYACVIGTVTSAMNGDVWLCLTSGGNLNDESADKSIVVTVGITAVSMVFPAFRFVSVIENTARQFRCETSNGTPQAIVEWYNDNGTPSLADDMEITTGKETYSSAIGTLIVSIGKLTLTVQRNDHEVGVYCRANNGWDWLYSSSVALDVQFGPKVQLPQTYDISEGSVGNYSCSVISGNPSHTIFIWTRSIDNRQWNSNFFSIASVQKSDDGLYTCTATNQMTPTGSPAQTGSHSGIMHLNVQYKSTVTDFHVTGNRHGANITQTEKTSTTFTCMVDSNPPSTIKIKKDGDLRRSANHSKQLEYTIANLACTDAGLYTCDASNQLNFDKQSAKDLHMYVTCSPRRPSGQDIKLNFTARLHDNVTLQYNVVAYPVPIASQFVWKRCLRRNMCIQLTNITAKYEITTMDLSSNLTIVDADIVDFGAYSLSIKNAFGELVEDMFLQSVGPPDTSSGFMVISNTVTSSSAVLSWIPGPNNGSPQTFHISYRVLDTLADWLDVSVQHNGEIEMNVTLHSLAPGRSYFVKCYALNIAGESAKETLTFSTLTEVDHAEPHVAGIAGGVTAGVITMVVIVVVFCVLRNQYSCAVTRKEGSRSRPTIPFAEIPGDNDAVTYETVSAKNNTSVYDVLSVGNEGPDNPHVYIPLDESMANPGPKQEESKTEVPIYHNTMAKNQAQTVL